MMRPRLLILLALVLAAVVLGACGGDDDSSDSVETVSKAEFIEMADAICTANDEAQGQLQADLQSAADPEAAAGIYDQLADQSDAVIAEIQALPKPAGEEEAIDQLAATQTEGVALVRELAAAVRDNDQAAGEDVISQLQQNAAEGDESDQAFGFQVC